MHEATHAPNPARVAALETRHRELDQRIDELSARPSADPLEITGLKKQKLRLKEKIALAS